MDRQSTTRTVQSHCGRERHGKGVRSRVIRVWVRVWYVVQSVLLAGVKGYRRSTFLDKIDRIGEIAEITGTQSGCSAILLFPPPLQGTSQISYPPPIQSRSQPISQLSCCEAVVITGISLYSTDSTVIPDNRQQKGVQ